MTSFRDLPAWDYFAPTGSSTRYQKVSETKARTAPYGQPLGPSIPFDPDQKVDPQGPGPMSMSMAEQETMLEEEINDLPRVPLNVLRNPWSPGTPAACVAAL